MPACIIHTRSTYCNTYGSKSNACTYSLGKWDYELLITHFLIISTTDLIDSNTSILSMSTTSRGHKLKPIFNPFSSKDARSKDARKRGHNNKKQAIIAAVLLLSTAAICFLTPASNIIAGFILLTIPIDEDISIGRESWRQMRHKYTYQTIPDRWGVSVIGNELARKIQSGSFCMKTALDFDNCQRQMRQYGWSFEVISAPEINAFALPGGIIRVTDSLLRQLQPTDGEIAALLGHEMGHVLHRHGQLKLLKKNLVNTILKALVYEDGDERQESFGEAVGELLLTGALYLGEMRFSRQDEYEADVAAFDILVHSGTYHPTSVQNLLEKLWSFSGESGAGRISMSWDKTHPATAERIEVLSRRWNDWDWHEKRMFNGRQR